MCKLVTTTILSVILNIRHTVQLGLLNVQEQLRNMVQSQIQELQPSPNLYNAVSGYLSAVVNSISYSQMDTKNRATVVIRHLLGWQETLCYNCSSMDQTLKYKVRSLLPLCICISTAE